jgi:hypothetical protein
MQSSFTTAVDTLYDAIVAFSVRVVRAYVYADEGLYIKDEPVREELVASTFVTELPAPAQVITLEAPKEVVSVSDAQKTPLTRGMVMYVGGVGVSLYKNPTIEFDAEITRIPFGAMVVAGEPKGRFYPVTWGNLQGWVLQDCLADRATHIYPVFTIGEENLVDMPNTTQVRAIIQDEFGLGRSEFPLQAGEYVTYRLWKRGMEIVWPDVRPRMPGNWHRILKGVSGVHVSTVPKVGAIMEYISDEEIGYLAYVDAVFPDESIAVSEVNNPDSGVYTETQLPKSVWKELRPVFIEVTSRR